MTSTTDTTNFFKSAEYDEDYWNSYLAARPHYDKSFYNSIYNYHRVHRGLMETAHDVGTGPGQVAAELAVHFKGVVASDINASHLAVASHRLDSLVSSQVVKLAQSTAETLTNIHAECSVDLITAAECLPLIDAEKAVQAFSTILRPNGTLAIWFYGRPIFAEADAARRCQPLLESILDMVYSTTVNGGGPQRKEAWKRATDRMASFLDDIELKDDTWQHVERRKWNSEYAMPFYGSDACDFEITLSSKIGPGEKEVKYKDLQFWERQWDLAGVRRFVQALLPAFDRNNNDDVVEGKYKELEEAMGGEGAVRKITWPVVLILASKK
ncbi:hypothetical protein BP5796_02874 [Coleophoma crateriformis]|uniref:Methyltransferase type 11 domain-containing protein n=1 Tax=Coleophoma crateriformis TaxID=565419 RepID=A0A3D8SZN8_9HELO|nr:hypothetical protein BP5796_02874 [Coleophoma crateriformis]